VSLSETGVHSDRRLKNMERVAGGQFLMGSESFYPEEGPVREVTVGDFWIDRHPVTVAEFRRFVKDTGYVTLAEREPDESTYSDADPDLLVPGSLVFHMAVGPVDLRDYTNWWSYLPGADWRHPEGPESTLHGKERHPVTHVAFEDAVEYAAWMGKELPTEAEWEYAARGGLVGATFAWGNDFTPRGRMMANTWQGEFPWQNLALDKFEGTSPVETYPANGYGLYDMTGNVWEWTKDLFRMDSAESPCCSPGAHRGEHEMVEEETPRKVIKGGSHLCAPNYCLRYRPAARQSETIDTSTSHIGFRCISRTTDQ
jgi:formylglycine-generating enzyme